MPIDVATPAVRLRALTWGPADAPIALCLHGFPDTAYGWRKVAPLLVDAGWRVVAPFMRGYAPSSIAIGRQLPRRRADGRRAAGARRRGPDGTRRDHRPRLGRHRGRRARRDARQPVRQGRDHVGAAGRGVPAVRSGADPAGWPRNCRVSCCGAGTSCTSNCLGCQNVPRPGSCRGCGGDGRPDIAPTRTCATSTPRSAPANVARRARLLPRDGPRQSAAGSTPNCTALAVAPSCHAVLHGTDDGCRSRLRAWRACCRRRSALVETPGISCSSSGPTSSRHIVDFVGSAR